MKRAIKKIAIIGSLINLLSVTIRAEEAGTTINKYVTTPYKVPYERPIGFSFNAAGLSSLSFEGRFFLGIVRNLSLVVSPMYQKTIELPIYNYKKEDITFFDFQRANLGIGIRGHFYDYDTRNNWYIEALGRGGMTWVGKDKMAFSVIPSLMVGYETVYESGYSVSFGIGLEYELLLGEAGPDRAYLKESYFISKFPIVAELSVGWMW